MSLSQSEIRPRRRPRRLPWLENLEARGLMSAVGGQGIVRADAVARPRHPTAVEMSGPTGSVVPQRRGARGHGGGTASPIEAFQGRRATAVQVRLRANPARGRSGIGSPIPVAPGVATDLGQKAGNVRSFQLVASQFTQQIANFPIKTAQVWGYNGSTPGPTLVAREGETVRVTITNNLPEPTTIHFHGMHEPNTADGVAGISQFAPIQPGQTYTYEFKPGHAGTFAYHTHTDTAVQEERGLAGMFVVLPRQPRWYDRVQEDFGLTLQSFSVPGEGQLVNPFPPGGEFNFFTINGKTGDASGGPMVINKGDLVRIRYYNASNLVHSMHLHGQDQIVVAVNGHPVPPERVTTLNVSPGEFFDVVFRANNPGNWIVHCSFPMHQTNDRMSGFNGAPVGMTRVFHYAGYAPVPPQYFSSQSFSSPTAG